MPPQETSTYFHGPERLSGGSGRLPGMAHFLSAIILLITILTQLLYHFGEFPRHEILEACLIQPAGIVFNFVLAMKGRDWGNMSRYCLVMNKPFRLLSIFCAVTLVVNIYIGYIMIDGISQYFPFSTAECMTMYDPTYCTEDAFLGAKVRVFLSATTLPFSVPACLFRIYDSCKFCCLVNLGLDPRDEPEDSDRYNEDYDMGDMDDGCSLDKHSEGDSLPYSDETAPVEDKDDRNSISLVGTGQNGIGGSVKGTKSKRPDATAHMELDQSAQSDKKEKLPTAKKTDTNCEPEKAKDCGD